MRSTENRIFTRGNFSAAVGITNRQSSELEFDSQRFHDFFESHSVLDSSIGGWRKSPITVGVCRRLLSKVNHAWTSGWLVLTAVSHWLTTVRTRGTRNLAWVGWIVMKAGVHAGWSVCGVELLCRWEVDRSVNPLWRVFQVEPTQFLNRSTRVSVLATLNPAS